MLDAERQAVASHVDLVCCRMTADRLLEKGYMDVNERRFVVKQPQQKILVQIAFSCFAVQSV